MPKYILKILLLVFLAVPVLNQSIFSQQWTKTFNGSANGDDKVTNAITDNAGNIYLTGYATRTGTGIDMCTMKYNSAGAQQWVKYYNGPGNGEDKAFGIAADNAGNIFITGYSTGTGSQADYTTIKYNSSGTEVWVQRYNTPVNSDDRAFGIAVDDAGYVYVTGYVTLANTDIYTVKYSPAGVYLWGQRFYGNAEGEDKAFGIASDGANIFISGYVKDSLSDFDIAVVKYDSSGIVKWQNIYNGTGNSDDKAFGIAVDEANHFIYCGAYSTGLSSGTDITMLKYSAATGDTAWVRNYNGSGNSNDKAFGIAVDAAGNPYITGTAVDDGTGNDYVTIKYNAEGSQQWASVYNNPLGNSEDIAYDIVVPAQLRYVFVTGSSRSGTSTGTEDIVTIRYNIENGEQSQINNYAGTFGGSDVGVKVVCDTSQNIFVAGFTQKSATDYDWIVYRFLNGDIIAVNPISTQVPGDFKLYQNYPNPFNPSTRVKFDIKKSGIVKLTLYDALGRESALLVNELLRPGSYEADINMAGFATGIYFYELSAGDYKEVKKMILLK